ncbi:hypothetical protein [Thermotalea metallivorans]|uniref:Uncharacterized protein n=1 Tax=Thermotalea metallivorans TaxID=520762 RepID=A0A140LEM5_9FIRM|nr:hypothetical protein [Thermotalea metallivorans]KXG79000.1 hypothetical protein AN619_00300 [Thermotalea metallivorans]
MYPYDGYWTCYEMEVERMYPEIYHRIYPHVCRICDREDHPYNHRMYPFPKREIIDRMVDEVYGQMEEDEMYRTPDGFGSQRNLLRDLIAILLIRELLDRRRFPRRRRPWAYY